MIQVCCLTCKKEFPDELSFLIHQTQVRCAICNACLPSWGAPRFCNSHRRISWKMAGLHFTDAYFAFLFISEYFMKGGKWLTIENEEVDHESD